MADASPTYRGFRKQFIYILWRILCDKNNENLRYQPEKIEDLAVWEIDSVSNALRLKELIQVKDYTASLTLSDFNLNNADSFFRRIAQKLPDESLVPTIISYGPLGCELQGWLDKEDVHVQSIVNKLGKTGINKEVVDSIVAQLILQKVDYEKMVSEIEEKLAEGPTSPDPKIALELLQKWIYDCCENCTRITKDNAIQKINSIGSFISERIAHAGEWGTVLSSLDDPSTADFSAENLHKEFYEGMDASLLHIRASCDILRHEFLNEIEEKFKKTNIVIIHGASGQGKSALAYRYIYDHHPLGLCYEVKNISDRSHALRIAKAITGYSKGCGNILLYIDVKPYFMGWDTLLADLRHCSNIKLLISVREEDWHIANLTTVFSYEEIFLELTKEEAKKIYDSYPGDRISGKISSFENGWLHFGENGPLLEFIHLITHGGNLESRLKTQIDRIHDQVTRGTREQVDIDILRFVSLSSVFGASCSMDRLMKHLEISSARSFRRLEDEYLLKIDGEFISGLHSIRSKKILDLICETKSHLANTVCEVIPMIAERELNLFLLQSFLHCPEHIEQITQKVYSQIVDSWIKAQNILEALLWLGVNDYVDENNELFRDIYAKMKASPSFLLDCFVANLQENKSAGVKILRELNPTNDFSELQALCDRQTDKRTILKYLLPWFDNVRFAILKTASQSYSAIGKVAFWASKTGRKIPIDPALIDCFIGDIDKTRISVSADFVVGMFFYDRALFEQIVPCRDRLCMCFKKETYTLKLEEHDDSVSIDYLVPFQLIEGYDSIVPDKFDLMKRNKKTKGCVGNSGKASNNDESVYRINLLRRLYPDKKTFNAKGHGHNLEELKSLEFYCDETEKHISIDYLYLDWDIEINAIFCNLAFYKFRPNDWKEYASSILAQRQKILDLIGLMIEACVRQLSDLRFREWFRDSNNSLAILKERIERFPVPQCGVDALGFTGECKVKGDTELYIGETTSRFCAYYDEYVRTIENFTNQFSDSLTYSAINKKNADFPSPEIIYEAARVAKICFRNLVDFVKNLDLFQEYFKILFGDRLEKSNFCDLELAEKKHILQLLGLMNICVNFPKRRISDPTRYVGDLGSLYDDLIKEIEKLLKKHSDKKVCFSLINSSRIEYPYSKQLWIVIDSSDYEAINEKQEFIQRELHKFLLALSPIKRTLLEVNFTDINLINCYKGCLFGKFSFSFYLSSVIRDGFSNANPLLTARPLPTQIRKKLIANNFDFVEEKISNDFIEASATFYAMISHLNDINHLSVCDDDMVPFFQKYIEQFLNPSNYLQNLFNAAETIVELCNGYITEEELAVHAMVPQCVLLMKKWYEIGIEPFWDFPGEGGSMRRTKLFSLNMFSEWATAYQEAMQYGNAGALYLMLDAIDQRTSLSVPNKERLAF